MGKFMTDTPVRDVSPIVGRPAADPAPPSAPGTVLDALDRRILAELQRDAAQSNLALAARVHASAPTCLRRVRRLVQAGVIERQVALLAPGALGSVLTALCEVTLDAQNAERLAAFQALACREPAVTQCYQVSPGPDFLLVVLLPDMPAYQALAQRLFTASAHVRNVRTFFAVNRAKFETQVPFA
jgi:Lrp/AsnC family leucine-responsive transcriptional regulator